MTKHANIEQTLCSKMTSQKQRTRLCVKNLPRYVSEDRLRDLFSQKGELTDVKIMRKNGKSREFGFVGYRTEQEAKEAIEFFNNNCIDTRKITCEHARKAGETETPHPWSLDSRKKHQKMLVGSKPPKVGAVNAEIYEFKNDDKYYNDTKFREFAHVMQPRKKSKLWENDALTPSSLEIGTRTGNKKFNVLECKAPKEDFSQRNAADGSTKEHGSKTFDSLASPCIKDEIEEILKTGRLYIVNLPYVASEDEVEKHFSEFGDISEVHLVVDKHTKRPNGRAFVEYLLPESAVRAFEMLSGSSFQGRLLSIKPAEEKNTLVTSNIQPSSKTFKQLKNEKRKASESSGDIRGWNRLFMNSDTITENIARKFGVSKSDILDREASDLAVRIALGESEVLAETKKALSGMGVNVAMLDLASGKTDDLKPSRVILVKNLPYSSCESALADMFGKYGNLDKVILPPTKTLALVIFLERADAFTCFHKFRYKCYKGKPLYLQFLSEDILSQAPLSKSDSNNSVVAVEQDSKSVLLAQQLEDTTDMDVDPDRIESRTLKVDNLSFKTSDDELRRHFTDHMTKGRVLSVRIIKNVKNGKKLSQGYGFIEFDSVNTAVRACKNMQRTNLDGHALKLQQCHAKNDECQHGETNNSKRNSKKLVVKNVAFEATLKDLRDLFSPFGQVKKVRLPKTYCNHHGYAFVEYATKQEATNTITRLHGTHLYGRRLILERAIEDRSLEELRDREGKLSKKRAIEDER